jgi:hypothetical protein
MISLSCCLPLFGQSPQRYLLKTIICDEGVWHGRARCTVANYTALEVQIQLCTTLQMTQNAVVHSCKVTMGCSARLS